MRHLVGIGGPSGAGKSTLCEALEREAGAAQYLRIPVWESYQYFVRDPKRWAYINQRDALERVRQVVGNSDFLFPNANLLLLDTDPVRVHLVHSWLYRRRGWIDDEQWGLLSEQVACCEIRPSCYLILDAPDQILEARISDRGRAEDTESGLRELRPVAQRWRDFTSPGTLFPFCAPLARISSDQPRAEMVQSARAALRELLKSVSNRGIV